MHLSLKVLPCIWHISAESIPGKPYQTKQSTKSDENISEGWKM